MTFEDLPPDWADQSLADPRRAADVLDLFVRDADRRQGGLAVLLCEEDGRLLQPIVVSMDHPASVRDKQVAVQRFCEVVRDHGLGGGLILACVRAAGHLGDDDREWHDIAIHGCAEAGVALLGFYLVTRGRIRHLPAPQIADDRVG